jgi:uncharacterized membrane protein HdeD (DUF308 family)
VSLAAKFYLQIVGGIILIVFGILFLLYLQITFAELTTDIIFIGAGILFIRKAFVDRRQGKIEAELARKNQKKNPQSRTGSRKIS